jgi:hypothetical protein
MFREFAFMPNFSTDLESLANLAEPEDWNYRHGAGSHGLPILRSYITSRYQRVAAERKISVTSDKDACCWHTGLFTTGRQPIFILFSRNRLTAAKAYWHFWKFAPEGQWVLKRHRPLPAPPHFSDEASALVFDPARELRLNLERLVAGNQARFPQELRSLSPDELQARVKEAIRLAIGRVRANYKTAVPQCYGGTIQLLLPLCLTDPRRADLALVLDRYAGSYWSTTCLPLDIAYNNARQLSRQDREWLDP